MDVQLIHSLTQDGQTVKKKQKQGWITCYALPYEVVYALQLLHTASLGLAVNHCHGRTTDIHVYILIQGQQIVIKNKDCHNIRHITYSYTAIFSIKGCTLFNFCIQLAY